MEFSAKSAPALPSNNNNQNSPSTPVTNGRNKMKDKNSICAPSSSSSALDLDSNFNNNNNSNKCPICNNSGDKLCQGCHTVFYCSVEHQKEHWKVHKSQCCPYTVKESPEFGRYLVAARNLPPGTTIIKELPVSYSPRPRTDEISSTKIDTLNDFAFLKKDDDWKIPICLTCCKKLIGKENNTCSKCRWPVCGSTCAKAKEHAENECNYFRQNKIKYYYRSSFSAKTQIPLGLIYRGILILRIMLKKDSLQKSNTNVWTKQLINLQWERNDGSNIFNLNQETWDFFKSFFKLNTSSNKLSDFNEWNKLNGIIEVNSYSIERVEMEHEEPCQVQLLFLKSSLLSHSCVPNCSWGVAYSPNFSMKVRSAKLIKKGEIISVSYNQSWNYYGTPKRKQMIMQTAGFNCYCERCSDDDNEINNNLNELGTFMSALKCNREKCTNGYLLQYKDMKTYQWKCNNSNCGNTITDDSIKITIDSIELELNRLQNICSSLPAPLMGLGLLDDFSNRYSNTLHPNHWILQQVARFIIGMQGVQLLQLDVKNLNRFIQHCNYLLTIYDVVIPGISMDRALLQMYLSRAWFLLYCENLRSTEGLKSEKLKLLTRIHGLQKEAWSYWKDDIQTKQLQDDIGFEARALQNEMVNIVSEISNL